MGNIRYRRAGIEDLEILVRWRMKFLQDFYDEKDEKRNSDLETEIKKYFEKSLSEDNYIAWFAEDNNEIIGTGGMAIYKTLPAYSIPNGKAGCILNMYTLHNARKQGVAAFILDKLIEEAKNKNIYFLHLLASKDGLNTYIKAGFEQVDNEFRLRL